MVKIGILGVGTVGASVAKILEENGDIGETHAAFGQMAMGIVLATDDTARPDDLADRGERIAVGRAAQRLECRVPGADANPYLVAAAVAGETRQPQLGPRV